MKLPLSILILLILFIPNSIYALNLDQCTSIGIRSELCHGFMNQSLKFSSGNRSTYENSVLLDTLSQGSIELLHKRYSNWNSKIYFNQSAPSGILTKSSRLYVNGIDSGVDTIYGAWQKIVTIMPSFIENEIMYVTQKPNFLIAYDYKFKTPVAEGKSENYQFSVCGGTTNLYKNKYGDCRTSFKELENSSQLLLKLDGIESENIGLNQSAKKVIISKNIPLTSKQVSIDTVLGQYFQVKHYAWDDSPGSCCQQECDEFGCWCVRNNVIYTCQYTSTSYAQVELELEDTKSYSVYVPPVTSNTIILAQNKLLMQGNITTSSENYEAYFGQGILSKTRTQYRLRNIYSPYDVLVMDKIPADYVYASGLNVLGGSNSSVLFSIPEYNNNECNIKYKAPFPEQDKVDACNIITKKLVSINVSVDKKQYSPNDKIIATITLSLDKKPFNDRVKITYGSMSTTAYTVQGRVNVTLTAQNNLNEIQVSYDGTAEVLPAHEKYTTFSVTDKGLTEIYTFLSLMFISLVILFLIRKWFYGNLV